MGATRVTRCRRLVPALCALAGLVGSALPLAAQQPPSPAQTNPLPTTTAPNPPADPNKSAAPAPEQAIVPPPAGQAAQPADPSRPPLVAKPAEAGDVDAVTLPAKPAAILAGKAKWEDAVQSLQKAFARIEADLAKDGIKPAVRPLAVFTKTEDEGFDFEAMIPIAAAPSPAQSRSLSPVSARCSSRPASAAKGICMMIALNSGVGKVK